MTTITRLEAAIESLEKGGWDNYGLHPLSNVHVIKGNECYQ